MSAAILLRGQMRSFCLDEVAVSLVGRLPSRLHVCTPGRLPAAGRQPLARQSTRPPTADEVGNAKFDEVGNKVTR